MKNPALGADDQHAVGQFVNQQSKQGRPAIRSRFADGRCRVGLPKIGILPRSIAMKKSPRESDDQARTLAGKKGGPMSLRSSTAVRLAG